MANFTLTFTFVTEISLFIGVILPVITAIHKLINGVKCQLRSEMLSIYYKHQNDKTIRQYEYENFVFLYQAYKALHGNSFIDKIQEEIKSWKVIS